MKMKLRANLHGHPLRSNIAGDSDSGAEDATDVRLCLYLRSDIAGDSGTARLLADMRREAKCAHGRPFVEIVGNGRWGLFLHGGRTRFDAGSDSDAQSPRRQTRRTALGQPVKAWNTQTVWAATRPGQLEKVLTAQMQAEIDGIGRAARTAGELRLARGIDPQGETR